MPLHWPVCYCRSLAKRPTTTIATVGSEPLAILVSRPCKPAARHPSYSVCKPMLLVAFASRGKCVLSVLKSEMLPSCMQLGFPRCFLKFSWFSFTAPEHSRKLRFWKVCFFPARKVDPRKSGKIYIKIVSTWSKVIRSRAPKWRRMVKWRFGVRI